MRETLGITSGLLALLFAAGAFSLLLLGMPPGEGAEWERATTAPSERTTLVASPLWTPSAALPASIDRSDPSRLP